MRTLLLAAVGVIFVSSSALACRATAEYPEVFEQLEASTIAPDRLDVLRELLGEGQKIHDEGHSLNDMSKMGEGIRILDEVKLKLGQ